MERIGPAEVIKEVINIDNTPNYCLPFDRNQYRER
jgi:DNA polymerase II large subunit